MADRVLIYGAGGHSGRLLARAAARRWPAGSGVALLLGGRRAESLAPLADELGLPTRVFALDDEAALTQALAEPGMTTVVNAAGPFAHTGWALARAAVRAGRHYVDLNGEADVYRRLDDLGYAAAQAGVALVSGAGHSSTSSDLLLELALRALSASGVRELGAVRIVYAAASRLSGGSLRTAWRSVREQVTVMRRVDGALQPQHLPAAQLERSFDFAPAAGPADRRIATLANLLDLYSARLTVQRGIDDGRLDRVRAIETWLEVPASMRLLAPLGPLLAPVLALSPLREAVQAQAALFGDGIDAAPAGTHTVLLQVDDGFGVPRIDWRLQTPDPYLFSARCVLAVVDALQRAPLAGWRTPAELIDAASALDGPAPALGPGLVLERRRSP